MSELVREARDDASPSAGRRRGWITGTHSSSATSSFPTRATQPAVLETARLIDELGYDLVGVQDHPY
jgi:hypothetical protein